MFLIKFFALFGENKKLQLQKYESVEDFKVPHLIEEEKIENPIDSFPESK